MKRIASRACLLGLSFDREDGTDIFLENVYWLSAVYTALYPKKREPFRTIAVSTSNPAIFRIFPAATPFTCM
jgi:hypothetical protein